MPLWPYHRTLGRILVGYCRPRLEAQLPMLGQVEAGVEGHRIFWSIRALLGPHISTLIITILSYLIRYKYSYCRYTCSASRELGCAIAQTHAGALSRSV